MKRILLVLVVGLLLVPVIPVVNTGSEVSLFDDVVLADGSVVAEGSVVKSECGSTVYLGGGRYSYSTVLGQRNTWNGDEWVSYVYDDVFHSVDFAGHTLTLNDWYAVFENESQVLVDDMRWKVEYWRTLGGGAWRELDLWEHSFLTPVESNGFLEFGQRYSDGFSSLEVVYRVGNNDQFKVALKFESDTVREYRFIWKFSGVDGDLVEDEKFVQFDDIGIGWGDAGLNATYDWVVAERKVDIVFDSFVGLSYVLDPAVNPVMGADGDDDWWRVDTNTHYTTSTEVYVYTDGSLNYTGQMRFALAVPQGSTIDSATITAYETLDSTVRTGTIVRIAEDNVGDLEADVSYPAVDGSQYATHYWDASGAEWQQSTVTPLVQTQVNLGGWASGQYIGFRFLFNYTATGNHRFEDYQDAGTNHAYMNVTYTAEGSPPVSTTTTTISGGVVTIVEYWVPSHWLWIFLIFGGLFVFVVLFQVRIRVRSFI